MPEHASRTEKVKSTPTLAIPRHSSIKVAPTSQPDTVHVVPTVSIVTAAHAPHAVWLESCAASILSQKLPSGWDLEWCLHLDGTFPVPELPDVPVFLSSSPTQLGASHSRNIAAARSRGDVLLHLDADDELLPGALENILPQYEDPLVSWVAVGVDDLVDSTRKPTPPLLTGRVNRGVVSSLWLEAYKLPFHSVGFSLRRDLFLLSGGYPALPAAEDVGLLLAATDEAPGVVLAPSLALYRKWYLQTTTASLSYATLRPVCLGLLASSVAVRASRRGS